MNRRVARKRTFLDAVLSSCRDKKVCVSTADQKTAAGARRSKMSSDQRLG